MTKDKKLIAAKKKIIENLEIIQDTLTRCVEAGMIDFQSEYHNRLVDLIDDAHIVDTMEELLEAEEMGKTLETDVVGWLSLHGRETVSLSWPNAKDFN
jgi:hypothetical protein